MIFDSWLSMIDQCRLNVSIDIYTKKNLSMPFIIHGSSISLSDQSLFNYNIRFSVQVFFLFAIHWKVKCYPDDDDYLINAYFFGGEGETHWSNFNLKKDHQKRRKNIILEKINWLIDILYWNFELANEPHSWCIDRIYLAQFIVSGLKKMKF